MSKEIIRKYFNLTFKEKRPDLAANLYLHDNYKHYGSEGNQSKVQFVDHFSSFFENNPLFQVNILKELEENETVVLLVRTTNQLVAEFYKVKDNRIIEHWHVIESIE